MQDNKQLQWEIIKDKEGNDVFTGEIKDSDEESQES